MADTIPSVGDTEEDFDVDAHIEVANGPLLDIDVTRERKLRVKTDI